jgi:hypothetical protein
MKINRYTDNRGGDNKRREKVTCDLQLAYALTAIMMTLLLLLLMIHLWIGIAPHPHLQFVVRNIRPLKGIVQRFK